MRPLRLAVAFGVLAAGVLPAQAWMIHVVRDVGTGQRLGKGASVFNEEANAQLAIVCLPEGLTATFRTGIKLTSDMAANDFAGALGVAETGGEFDMFEVMPEETVSGDTRELVLRFSAGEAMGLAEYVLNSAGITVSYAMDGEEMVRADYDDDSAAISIGAVLGECEGR